jgi:TonB family protein
MNPVAHEARVVATGARPTDGSGKRELFTEATTTVLVFENGGVIRLDAAVAQGQLLFLTNQENKREVVAQVTRKRIFRPTSCYVELEFTEPSPGFWGIEFPETPQLVPANTQQAEAAELVQSAEIIGDETGEAPAAPSVREVDALKNEVEALREQLKLLQQASEKVVVPMALPNASATPNAASERPSPQPEEPQFSEEVLLPKLALDFGKGATSAKPTSAPKTKAASNSSLKILLFGLLTATLLFVALGVAWYRHWIPGLGKTKNVSAAAAANASRPVNPVSAAGAAPQKASDTHIGSSSAAHSNEPSAGQPTSSGQVSTPTNVTAEKVAASDAVSSQPPASSNEVAAPVAKPTATARPSAIKSTGKRSSQQSSSNVMPVSVATSSSDVAAIVPPKLLKSVRPNPPAEALRDYVSGNVTLDAFVDTTGHVKSMKVISGPQTLRNAAMDALKQYSYQPATQKGKPVSAHVNVTIQFWYEP